MSIYLANKEHLDRGLTLVADAIRAKTGETNLVEFPDEFVSKINSINTGNIIFDSRIYDYGTGYNPLTLTIENFANLDYVDFTIESSIEALPIFNSISFFTCKLPGSSTATTGGYLMPGYTNTYKWSCFTPGFSGSVSWNEPPTVTILSTSTTALKLRLPGISTPTSTDKKGTRTLSSPTDNSYVLMAGK